MLFYLETGALNKADFSQIFNLSHPDKALNKCGRVEMHNIFYVLHLGSQTENLNEATN